MVSRAVSVVGAVVVAVTVPVVVWLTQSEDAGADPAAQRVADLPLVTSYSIDAETDGCAFDADRGGLVIEGLTVTARSSGRLPVTFHVERDSLDDVMPGYVLVVLAFDDDTRSRTFDLVIPATREQVAAGYDECRWTVGPV